MTRGGPGFTSDVIASVIYKQYQAGFYGLVHRRQRRPFRGRRHYHRAARLVAESQGVDADDRAAQYATSALSSLSRRRSLSLCCAFHLHFPDRGEGQEEASRPILLAARLALLGNLVDVIKTRDYMLLLAFFNSTILTVGARYAPRAFGRDDRLRAAAAAFGWDARDLFFVLAGLIIPPAVVPTIWVLQGMGLFKTHARAGSYRGRLRAIVHRCCCSGHWSRRSHGSSTRRPIWTGPGQCGSSFRSFCRC